MINIYSYLQYGCQENWRNFLLEKHNRSKVSLLFVYIFTTHSYTHTYTCKIGRRSSLLDVWWHFVWLPGYTHTHASTMIITHAQQNKHISLKHVVVDFILSHWNMRYQLQHRTRTRARVQIHTCQNTHARAHTHTNSHTSTNTFMFANHVGVCNPLFLLRLPASSSYHATWTTLSFRTSRWFAQIHGYTHLFSLWRIRAVSLSFFLFPFLSLSRSLSLNISLSHTHAHAHTLTHCTPAHVYFIEFRWPHLRTQHLSHFSLSLFLLHSLSLLLARICGHNFSSLHLRTQHMFAHRIYTYVMYKHMLYMCGHVWSTKK